MKCRVIQSGRQTLSLSKGFTAVELLITLFIAAAFLTSGYQLYGLIIKDGGETRMQARASNVAYDYLQRYKPTITNPCTVQTPLTDWPITVTNLSNVIVSIAITCPYTSATSISKVLVTVKYNTPQQTVSNATYVTPTLLTNLIAYWKLDESSGNAFDSVGSYTGTNTSVTYSAGKINNGGIFNGTTSYIEMLTSSGVTFTNQLTLSAWVKPASYIHAYTDRGIITKNGDLGEVFWLTHLGDPTGLIDTLAGCINIGGVEKWIASTTHPVPATWYHLVMTYDGIYQKVYINGTLETTISLTGNIVNSANNIVIGARSLSGTKVPGRVFNGSIDEVGIWSQALSAGLVTTLYNAGNGVQYPFN